MLSINPSATSVQPLRYLFFFQANRGILRLNMSRKRTIEDMYALAKSHDDGKGKCLSTVYVNGVTKLRWQCAEKHEWEAQPSSIQQGHWCPTCAGKSKKTLADMQVLARKRGGKCLSTMYVNIFTKLLWQCAEKHEWKAIPGNIKKGQWCPTCAGLAKKTIADMHALAKRRGGKCLSTVYVNNATKLLWQCGAKHVWETRPKNIKQGQWCPTCAIINRRKKTKRGTDNYVLF